MKNLSKPIIRVRQWGMGVYKNNNANQMHNVKGGSKQWGRSTNNKITMVVGRCKGINNIRTNKGKNNTKGKNKVGAEGKGGGRWGMGKVRRKNKCHVGVGRSNKGNKIRSCSLHHKENCKGQRGRIP